MPGVTDPTHEIDAALNNLAQPSLSWILLALPIVAGLGISFAFAYFMISYSQGGSK
jgi:hypothetical protein